MFFAVQLPDNWLVSAAARRVYIVSAVLSLFCFGLLFAIELGASVAGGTLERSPLLSLTLKLFLVPGAVGNATILIGMQYFWFRCHPSESTSKVPWVAVLWGFPFVGPLLYFFMFYLRSPLVPAARSKDQAAAARLLNSTA
jgi:hypothetical protein